MRVVQRLVGVLATAALLLVGLLAGPSVAHDSIVSSDPAVGSTITAVPATITITFDGEPQGPTAKVGVIVGDAAPVSMTGTIQGTSLIVDTADPALAATLADPSGPWVVSYQIVSSDGDPVTGSVAFTVDVPGSSPTAVAPGTDGASPSPGSPAEAIEDSGSEGLPTWAIVLIGVGAIGAAAAAFRMLTGRRSDDAAEG